MRYFIYLQYNGKSYCGWQRQKNGPSVQEVLETCLSTLLGEEIPVTGCGRTDTGVHASSYAAHFDSNKLLPSETTTFIYKANSFLPPDVAISDIKPVKPDAHARFDAISRTYTYHISGLKNPFERDFHMCLPGKKFDAIDIDLFNEGCRILMSHSDFSAFAKTGSVTKTNICKITEAHAIKANGSIVFTITADRFLRNMVRAVTGTLLDVAMQKITLSDLDNIIRSGQRSRAGTSVQAQGLFLSQVLYPLDIFDEKCFESPHSP